MSKLSFQDYGTMNSSSGLINALLVSAVLEEYVGMMLVLSRLKQVKKRKKRKQRIWTRPWLLRGNYGIYETLLSELQADDAQSYKNFLRMDVQQFRQLLARLGPRIEKEDTHYIKSIPQEVRLAITLRFLADKS